MHPELPIEIDCRAVEAKLQAASEFLLVDCRESDEHATARIAGARLLPMSRLADSLHELEAYREREIVIHCHHGVRSLKVARWLREQGFSQAQSMTGGIDCWSLEIDQAVPRY
jgi:rhodanese-related sulfurtransferase